MAFALAAVLLAGCIGADEDAEEDIEAQERAEVTEDTGGIEGTVTNAAVEAVPEATVTLEETGESTQTAADGSFAFSEIMPGTYTLTFEAEGFLSTEQEVSVVANEVTVLDVVLTEEPDLTPYLQQFEYTGFIECSVGAATGTHIASLSPCGYTGATNHQTVFVHEIEPDPWQIVTEVDWDPGTPLSDRFWMNSETNGFNNAWNVAYASTQETPPIVYNTGRERLTTIVQNFEAICEGEMDPSLYSNQYDNPEAYCGHNPIENGAEIDVSVSVQTADTATVSTPGPLGSIGIGLGIQQDFTVYQSVFYHAPACEDFSILEGNECAQSDQPPEEDPYEEWLNGNETDDEG